MNWWHDLIDRKETLEYILKEYYLDYIEECVKRREVPMGFYWWTETHYPETVEKIEQLRKEIEKYEHGSN